MAIRTVVTRGYGNGTFNGTIADVVLRGYDSAVVLAIYTIISALVTLQLNSSHTVVLSQDVTGDVVLALEKNETVTI